MMKSVLFILQITGILIIALGGYHLSKARQIEGMGALGAGFMGAAEIGLGAFIMTVSAIVFWIQKWRAGRRPKQ